MTLALHLQGEFEPHVGCWMGWPYSPYLWRENAKPAQQQYAAIAKAISEFEPVWMFADPSVRVMTRTSDGIPGHSEPPPVNTQS